MTQMRHVTDWRTASDYHISEEQFDSSCNLFIYIIYVRYNSNTVCITVHKDGEGIDITLSHVISRFPHKKGTVTVCDTKSVAMEMLHY